MPSATTDQARLHLTAELRAVDAVVSRPAPRKSTTFFSSELRRFPPIEDVVVTLDRVAKRAFAT
ncbi:hypothetical protein [Tabrizicola thermarum]|uniref:hypothetical protein n=1 Tax=Tabrizicola thermarum TaxID=2670345 RepID=UPI000FFC39CE|nr:hypothetical protein [Tabrizicola thermarum]